MNDESLRVLIISQDFKHIGGVVETAQLLISKFTGKIDVSHGALGRRVGQVGVKAYVQPLLDMFNFFKLTRKESFDVIHVNPSFNVRSFVKEFFVFMLFCLLGYSGKILLFFHGWDPDFFQKLTSNLIGRKFLLCMLRRAGLIVVLSSKYRKSLIDIGIDEDKVVVLTTMYNKADVPSSPEDITARNSVLFLSRIVRKKGVFELVEAFEDLFKRHQNLHLIMAGDGPDKTLLEELVRAKNIENISFPGYIKGAEKRKAFEQSSIFILPTFYSEGCPVSLLEAMAAGIAPVVPLAGGIADIVIPDETAIILETVSKSSIISAIDGLLGDTDRMKLISKNAESYAKDNFESAKVCDRILDLYRQIKSKVQ
ncbi:glycosyltransferase family 4 protein [Maridesulfovibrio frigidus]|uniref:glycosyltransferase family 4 protein n=1 Tax=Maridesulfovibrio frigidus TaxID=340956 RepID=UPI0004E16AA7|nr:glycosyltransferase family 4 protein [Maridesulfovibrio frigidus]